MDPNIDADKSTGNEPVLSLHFKNASVLGFYFFYLIYTETLRALWERKAAGLQRREVHVKR